MWVCTVQMRNSEKSRPQKAAHTQEREQAGILHIERAPIHFHVALQKTLTGASPPLLSSLSRGLFSYWKIEAE